MSETEKKNKEKPADTSKELALVVRKPLMLEAGNEEKTSKSSTSRAKTTSTKKDTTTATPKRTPKTISETTSKTERRPKPSAKSRVIPVTIPPRAKKPTASSNTTKGNKTNKNDMKLPLFRRIHIKPSHIVCVILIALLAIFFGRVALWEHDYLARMEGSDRDTPAANGTSGVIYDGDGNEAEMTETEIVNYVVPANMPRYFSIPSLGIVNVPIAEVGLRADGSVDVPGYSNVIGWYNGSVLPGAKGASLLDAHGGDLGDGIFRTLPRIQIGADINIEMGDGRLFTYKVVDTATRPLDGENSADQYMPTALTPPQGSTASLTLITCTGEWSQIRQTYLNRFFARAVLQ